MTAGVDRVVTALPARFDAGQVAVAFQATDAALNRALGLAALTGDSGDRRPASALVIGAIRQRKKNDLLTVGQIDLPNEGHDADTHRARLAFSFSISVRTCAAGTILRVGHALKASGVTWHSASSLLERSSLIMRAGV